MAVVRTILLFWISHLFISDDDGHEGDTNVQEAGQTIQTQVAPQAPVPRSRPTKAAVHLVVRPD